MANDLTEFKKLYSTVYGKDLTPEEEGAYAGGDPAKFEAIRQQLSAGANAKLQTTGQATNQTMQSQATGNSNVPDYSKITAPTYNPASSQPSLADAVKQSPGYNATIQSATGTTLKDAIAGQQQQVPNTQISTYMQAQGNSDGIKQAYSSLADALNSRIQQQQNEKQAQFNKLGEIYQPQRNNSEVMRNNDLRSVLEQSANAGDRGGVGRQNALETQTSADNRMNAIDLQQKSDETSLKDSIANIRLEGDIQQSQYSSQMIKDLIADKNRVEETNYTRLQDALANQRVDKQFDYQKERDMIGDKRYDKEYVDNMAQRSFDNAMATANFDMNKAHMIFVDDLASRGFTSEQANMQWEQTYKQNAFEADEKQRATDNEARSKEFEAAEKQRETENKTNAERAKISDAWKRVESLGYVDAAASAVLNIKEGTTTVAARQADADLRSTNATTDNVKADTEYQNLVTAGYPAEQAAKMAKAKAELTGANLQNDYQELVNAGYTEKEAMEIAQAKANLTSTDLSNEGKSIELKYADRIARGQIDAQELDNSYQKMVNSNYPKEEAAKIAGILAQTAGVKLDNAAQSIANKYAAQIQQGQIDEQKLKSAYQKLTNAGYAKELASKIAVDNAQIRNYNNQVSNRNKETNYDVNKPYYNPKTGTNSNTKYNYKDDASFQATYAAAIKDQAGSLTKMKADPAKFINAFGIDGFKVLYSAASPKNQAIDFSFLKGLE